MKDIKILFPLLMLLFSFVGCRNENSNLIHKKDLFHKMKNWHIDTIHVVSLPFQFLGEKGKRKDNFDDTTHVVTLTNVERLYRAYEVSFYEDGEYCLIESKKVYEEARYLSRLIHFSHGKQVAARTFYDYSLRGFLHIDDRIIVGLNSLSWSGSNYPSSFDCKIVMMSKDFVPLKSNVEKYKHGGEYTYIDTMFITKEGNIQVDYVNTFFDGDGDYRYTIIYDEKLHNLSKSSVNKCSEDWKRNETLK